MLLGASVAAVNYVFLLIYHFNAHNPVRQAWSMGLAAVFSWAWQIPLFLYMPLKLLWTNKAELSTPMLAFFSWFAVAMFVIDSKCNVVRIKVMWKKLASLHTEQVDVAINLKKN